jgi:hypothetical protein
MSKTIIKVHTSCGEEFRIPVDELTDRQLKGLLEQNADNPEADQLQIAAMRDELKRRQPAKQLRKSALQEWREEAGIHVPPPETCELWSELQRSAFEVIRVGELEKSGIRDGMGYWHGGCAIEGVLGKLREVIGRITKAYDAEVPEACEQNFEKAMGRIIKTYREASPEYGSCSDEVDDEIPF